MLQALGGIFDQSSLLEVRPHCLLGRWGGPHPDAPYASRSKSLVGRALNFLRSSIHVVGGNASAGVQKFL